MSAAPLVSIIVPCRNPGPRLRDALGSVWGQTDASFEVIVIDGGSTDGSREWLESNRDRIAVLVSEPDGGIYDAMNKAIARASGEWLLFLGADDRLAGDSVLHAASERLLTSPTAGVVVGEAMYDDGRIYRLAARPNPVARNFVHHQASFYRRRVFAVHGSFDTTLNITADYDLNLRLWTAGVRFEPMTLRVAFCGTRGASDCGAWKVYRQEITTRHRHFPSWRCWPWDVASVVRFLRKQLVTLRDR